MAGIGATVPLLAMTGAAVWSPTLLGASLRAWYNDDLPCIGENWYDYTGLGNTLVRITGTTGEGSRNGRPTVTVGGDARYQTPAMTSNHPVELWAACKCETYGVIMAGRTSDATLVVRSSSTTSRVQLANEYGVLVNFTMGSNMTNRWLVLRARFNGAASQVWENGVQRGESAVSSSLNPSGLTIGAGSGGWSPITAEYGEVLMTGLLNSSQARKLNRYLQLRWAIT